MPNLSSLTTNFFATPNEGFTTTTSAPVDSSSATVVPFNSVSGLTNSSVFTGLIDPGNAKERAFTGVVDTGGSQITSVKFTTGTDATHTTGATIVDYVTGTHLGAMTKGILVEHKQTGAHSAVTADSLTVGGVPLGKTSINAPQGFLINGKIETSVATNDLTVAIKTLAGTNPSATDPVYCRIGNTVRAITSALSVTKNDGTNWFNSGAAETATLEIDYFVYLGYNATDGVVIGFARIPYGRVYGDFSTTTTNDKYCAISTITNAASTDEYELVGRFNAVLSATASFNWSIPATSIVVNRPVRNTRTLTWIPTHTGFSSAPSGGVYTYTLTDNYCALDVRQGSNGTSNATSFAITSPITAATVSGHVWFGAAFDHVDNGTNVTGVGRANINSAGSSIAIATNAAGGTWTAANGKRASTNIRYQI